jgi:hypothetical protein
MLPPIASDEACAPSAANQHLRQPCPHHVVRHIDYLAHTRYARERVRFLRWEFRCARWVIDRAGNGLLVLVWSSAIRLRCRTSRCQRFVGRWCFLLVSAGQNWCLRRILVG